MAQARLAALNPEVQWRCLDRSLDPELAAAECRQADLAIDCADNALARRTLAAAALAASIPLVHGAVAGFEGAVCVFGPTGKPCFGCLYPSPPERATPPPVLGAVVGVVGALMAGEVIRLLAGTGPARLGELLLIDLERGSFDRIRVELRPGCELCGGSSRAPRSPVPVD